ncbi:neutral/alkaline nonlysosomal ceramidase, putative [Talaromyces stipitatus ATCC 10500]|uniref:Neutral ceramidase n=1 Tax=Talaromyces stipitatus (strain ATCC 10500 / CBS 375.48 / QM 6759 / NRRL 1006) TaxID=441959 RepID=B8LUN2_TALSN|nr:neutral/alkaline nonlysosomal ceramidase, putative [Talaromyces stipitatus ATCC 10500]EED23889.1 neutral/alkaline nonlysosomal ceramidase, putative [Talaromyces stipitatus ATCC 10500]
MARWGFMIALLVSASIGLLFLLQVIAGIDLGKSAPHYRTHRPILQQASRADDSIFLLGAGKADITGPVVEVALNGYANLSQIGTGLRQRIYSRAFIIADPNDTNNTFIYLVLDAQSGDTAVRHGVLQGLAKLGAEYARYGEHNIALSGTHAHSGPGAWMNYLLPQIPTFGFDPQSYQALVDGALLSIQRAHESLTSGRLSYGTIDIPDGNTNRSPYAYLANPEEERAQYEYNTDKTMSMLRFDRTSDSKTFAVLTFFSVHGTSLYENNTLTAGDNKGVAAYLFERSAAKDNRFANGFIAGFSQSSVGDTSPNVLGAYCEDTGLPCRFEDSTCNGQTELCRGRGPYFSENDAGSKSCFEIGRRQYTAAKQLYDQLDTDGTQILGSSSVSSFHVYHDFTGYEFPSPFNGTTLSTCYAALGFSFAAGTTDGPGQFDFTQNGTGPAESNPVWYVARAFIHQPSAEQQACQAPKEILLDAGAVSLPYAWAPNIVDIQLLRIGQLIIIVSPSEVTTMSGRRWKNAILKASSDVLGITNPLVVLGSPANTYAHYVATEEEYSVQRYEGASTLYGPNELAGYINLTLTYLPYLGSEATVAQLPPIPAGPNPPINTNNSLNFIPGVVYDSAPIGKSFGDVTATSPNTTTYGAGDTISVTFVGANPRNNLRQEGTFGAVEWLNPASNKWQTVRTDADWNLIYQWERTNTVLGYSDVVLSWQIEDSYYAIDDPNPVQSGSYRLHYYGDSKSVLGVVSSFEGVSSAFTVKI